MCGTLLSSARVNWLTQMPTQRKADKQGYFVGWNNQTLLTVNYQQSSLEDFKVTK